MAGPRCQCRQAARRTPGLMHWGPVPGHWAANQSSLGTFLFHGNLCGASREVALRVGTVCQTGCSAWPPRWTGTPQSTASQRKIVEFQARAPVRMGAPPDVGQGKKVICEGQWRMPSQTFSGNHRLCNGVCGGGVGHEQAEKEQEGPLLLMCLPGGRGTHS